MFGAPGPWTPVAKTCPGPDRVKQLKNEIVPWLQSRADLEDEMVGKIEAPNGEEWNVEHALSWMMMKRLSDLAPWGEYVTTPGGEQQWSLPHAVNWLMRRAQEQPDPAEVAAAVVAQLPDGSLDQATAEAAFRNVLSSLDE